MATKSQVEALRWLIERGHTERIDSVALYPLYQSKSKQRPHAMRVVAWKRVSGANMARMERDGLLSYDHSLIFGNRMTYTITDKGREAVGGKVD